MIRQAVMLTRYLPAMKLVTEQVLLADVTPVLFGPSKRNDVRILKGMRKQQQEAVLTLNTSSLV